MPFVPHGKKTKRRVEKTRQEEAHDQLVDEAVSRVHHLMQGRGLCLPMCVLLQRVLAIFIPQRLFHVRLGALNVFPLSNEAGLDSISYDPRGPDGIDGGFHTWLEDNNGLLLDPSILMTLHADGYDVNPRNYLLDGRRRMPYGPLGLIYEELPNLELLGVEESEPALAAQMRFVLTGIPPMEVLEIHLDVGWRAGVERPAMPSVIE